MNVDYQNLSVDLESGSFRESLRRELVIGFRAIREEGERLPPPSYYATKIVEVIHQATEMPLDTLAYDLYQEVLLACEDAHQEVLEEKISH